MMAVIKYIRLTAMLLLISGGCQKKEESFKRFIDENYNIIFSPGYDQRIVYNFRTDSLTAELITGELLFADTIQFLPEEKEAIAQLFFDNNIFKIRGSQTYDGDIITSLVRYSIVKVAKNNKIISILFIDINKSEEFDIAHLPHPKNVLNDVSRFHEGIENIFYKHPKFKHVKDSTENYKMHKGYIDF